MGGKETRIVLVETVIVREEAVPVRRKFEIPVPLDFMTVAFIEPLIDRFAAAPVAPAPLKTPTKFPLAGSLSPVIAPV